MPLYFTMRTDNPQPRLIKKAAEALLSGEIIAYPTDSTYALGCILSNRHGLETIRQLRGLNEKHPLTLICSSIAQAAHYCTIDDQAFKILKQFTPGPYTFILPATKLVPRLAQGIKRKVTGVRIPNHAVALALIAELGGPLLSTTLWLKGEEEPITDPEQIIKHTKGCVGLILDGGIGSDKPTSVVDIADQKPVVVRKGLGDVTWFESNA
ncbi:MAG: L-threonylcarbamoyladenylate synthase [Candidatus Berkiellales bacterium]